MNTSSNYIKNSVEVPQSSRVKKFFYLSSLALTFLACLFVPKPLSAQTEMKKGMEMEGGMKMEMATEGIFEGKGKVIALVPEKSQIVVGHEEIKGFMKAMPMGMGYGVESTELLKGLNPGDPIKFKVDAAKKKIIAIERVK